MCGTSDTLMDTQFPQVLESPVLSKSTGERESQVKHKTRTSLNAY